MDQVYAKKPNFRPWNFGVARSDAMEPKSSELLPVSILRGVQRPDGR